MGGGRKFHYPKWVWSPSGGWWANPVHWKRNGLIYVGVCFVIASYAYSYGEKNTKVYKRKYVIRDSDADEHESH